MPGLSMYQEAYNTLYEGKTIRMTFENVFEMETYIMGMRTFKNRNDRRYQLLGFLTEAETTMETNCISKDADQIVMDIKFVTRRDKRRRIIPFTIVEE